MEFEPMLTPRERGINSAGLLRAVWKQSNAKEIMWIIGTEILKKGEFPVLWMPSFWLFQFALDSQLFLECQIVSVSRNT